MSKRFFWQRIASDKSLFRRGLPGQVRRRRLHVESLEQRAVLDAGGLDVGGLAFGVQDAFGVGNAVVAAGALASDSASLTVSVSSLPENTSTAQRIKVADVTALVTPGQFMQPSGTTAASVPTAYFDVATGVLQIDPAGRDLSLFNFTYNTSVANVTDSTSGPFTYGWGSGNPGSVSSSSAAHTLPSGTWSLVTTSSARLAGAVSLTKSATLATTGAYAASTSGWLNRPWSFGQVVSPGLVTAADARQNFIALNTTADVGYGAGRGLFQYTIDGVVGNFYGSVVVTSSAVTAAISGPDAASFEVDGAALYLKAGVVLDYESKASYGITVSVPQRGTFPYTLTVTDVEETPSVALTNTVTSLPENTVTTPRIKVADVTVSNGGPAAQPAPGGFVQPSGTTVASVPTAYFDAATGVLQIDPAGRDLSLFNFTYNTSVANVTDSTSGPFTYGWGSGNPGSVSSGSTAHMLPSGTWSLVTTSPARLAGAVSLTNSGTLSTTGSYAASTSGWLNRPWSFGQVVSPGSVTAAAARQNFIALNTTADVGYGVGRGLFQYTISRVVGNFYGSVVVTSSALTPVTPVISGPDAASFEIDGGALYLKAGVSLDYETKTSYAISVSVPQGNSVSYTLSVTDVAETPVLSLTNVVTSLPENTVTTPRIKVADLSVVAPQSPINVYGNYGTVVTSIFSATVGYVNGIQNNTLVAQGFTTGTWQWDIKQVDVALAASGVSATDSRVYLFGDNHGVPGSLLSTYLLANGPVTNSKQTFFFTGSYVTSPSTNYWLVVGDTNSQSQQSSFEWHLEDTGATPSQRNSSGFSYLGTKVQNFSGAPWTDTLSGLSIRVSSATVASVGPVLSGTDASAFEIVGNALYLKAGVALDYETKTTYAVTVSVPQGNSVPYTLSVTNVNETPTDVQLSPTSIAENQPAGTTVGTLSTTDPDAGDTFTYSLVSGLGSADNASFMIVGNQLKTAASFDYETKNAYSIRVRSTDAGGLSTDKTFTISVTNVNESPSVWIDPPGTSLPENTPTTSRIKVGDVVVNASDVAVPGGFVQPSGTTVASVPTAYFDVATGVLQLDPAGRDLSLFNFTYNTSVANVTDSTSGPFTYGFGSGNPGSVSSGSTAHTLPSGTWSLVTTSPARLAGAVSLTNSGTLLTTGSYAASTSGWLNRPWSFGQVVSPGSVTAAAARQNFIALNTTADVGYGAGRGLFQYTISGAVGNFYGSVVVTSSALLTPVISGPDAGSFEIDGGALYLKAGVSLDYVTKTSYSITVSVPRGNSVPFTLGVTNVNESPTDMQLSPTSIAENQPAGTTVGTFSTTDPDAGDTFTYSLVSGPGSADNASFTIVGSQLKSAASFDYETKNSYSIRVRSTDAGGLSTEKTFTISVTNVNEVPTDVQLSPTSIAENQQAGTTVGTLSTTDPDSGDTFTYSLVSGDGSTDNASFTIVGNQLKSAASFDYETKNSYSIRVRSTDAGRLSTEKTFLILVTNVDEPTSVRIDNPVSSLPENTPTTSRIKVGDVVVNAGDGSSFAVPGGFVQPSGTTVASVPTAYFDVATGVLQLDPAGRDLSLFNFTFNTSVANVTDSTSGPFTYGWGSGNPGSVSSSSAAHTLPSGTWSLVSTSPARLAGAVSLSRNPTLSTTGSYAASTSGWLNRPWSFGQVVSPGSVTAAAARQNFIALNTTADVGYGAGRGLFQYTIDGVVGNFYGSVVVTSSAFTPVTPVISGPDAASFEIDGNAIYLKAGVSLDYETKTSYSIAVSVPRGNSVSYSLAVTDVSELIRPATSTVPENIALGSVVTTLSRTDAEVGLTPLTVVYVPSSGQMVFLNTTSASLAVQSVQIVSASRMLNGSAAILPSAAFSVLNTSDSGLYGAGSEIFFLNFSTAALTLAGGGKWDMGLVAQGGLTSGQVLSSFATDPDVDYLPGSRDGQFIYQLVGGENVRGLISYGYRTYTYSLVPGIGDTDNGLFSIDGTSLKVAGVIDYEAKSRYSIRVRSTSLDGVSVEEVLSVIATDVNEAPTDIRLSPSSVAENQPAGTSVGTFSTTDPDVGDSHTYTLVSGTGDTDNGSFEIVGGTLKTRAAFDYETKSSYTIRVRSTDAGGLYTDKQFTIAVVNVNEAPTNIVLSPLSVAENQPVGTTVGTFSTTDPDAGDSHTYALVAGTGDTDNGSFEIVGNVLKAKASFNYEVKNSYSFRVRTTDSGGLLFEKQFTILVTDVNEAPTGIRIDPPAGSLPENTSTVSRIKLADIVVTDDALGTNILSLSGADVASFEIVGAALYLKAGVTLDYETKRTYAVTVSVADSGLVGPASVRADYTLSVTNVNEAPTDIVLTPFSVPENQPAGTSVGTFSTTDQDVGDTFTYTLVPGTGSTDNGSFEIVGGTLKTRAAFDYEVKSSYSIRVRSTDAGGLFTEKVFTILVTDVNDAPTDIVLTPFSVPENQPAGTSVGTFSTTDQDAGDRHTYTLVAGTGDADNGSFEIVGGTLKTRVSFDYETKSSYTIRVRSTDTGGLYAEKQITILVIDVNEAPTAVGFANGLVSLPESTSTASRVKVADVVVTDDALGTNTLSLSGADAGYFELVGSTLYLKAGTSLDYGPKPSYAVTVSAADATLAAAPVSAVFAFRLINVPEFSGREYVEVPAGQTAVDTTVRTGSRQVIVRGGGTLVLAGANANTGGVRVESGALIVRNASALGSGTLDVRAGAAVTLDIGFTKATVGALSLASGAKIDLGVSGLTIAAGGTTLDALRSAILLARNGGTWNGTSGIGSANVDLKNSKVVGYRQTPTGSFQVAWAAFGDTNLDGRINSTDVQAINTGKKFGLSTRDSVWSQGDFSYDGRVNSTDILLMSPQFGKPSYYTTTVSPGTIDAPVPSLTAQLFAALAGIDPDGDGKL